VDKSSQHTYKLFHMFLRQYD